MPTDSVRLIARIILKLQQGGDFETEYVAPSKPRKFKDLMSHYKELKEDKKRMEHFLTICEVLKEYLSDTILPNPVELLGIYGRMCINSFNIVNGEMQAVGTGIYLAPSILDHSCSPNAVVTFEGIELRLQMIQDLPVLNWDSIKISYIDLLNSNADRLNELKERYYFDCDCPRCNSDDIDKYQYALKCPSCSSPVPVKKKEKSSVCACKYKLDEVQHSKFWDAVDFSEQQLRLMHDTNYWDVCKMCLDKQGNLFHDLSLVRSKILDAAFDSSIQLELWDAAVEYGVPLIVAYKLWYGERHPMTAILLLKLFKILLLTSTDNDSLALNYYSEAVAILEMTHGKSCSFYCKEVKPLLHLLNK